MRGKIIITLICLLVSKISIGQEIHKWTDKNGKVHFSDNPPKNTKTEVVETGDKISEYRQERTYQRIHRPTGGGRVIKETGSSNKDSTACLSAKKRVKTIQAQLRQSQKVESNEYWSNKLRAAKESRNRLCK